VDPVAEPSSAADLLRTGAQSQELAPAPPPAVQRAAQRAQRKREYPNLLKHYRRPLNLLLLVFLGVGIVGWTYRWYVLREVLLQFQRSHLPARAARDIYPLLCETLLHDHSSGRRLRSADLLGDTAGRDYQDRGALVWEALLSALADPDPRVEEAAWESLWLARSPPFEPGAFRWLTNLPVARCVDVLSRTKSPLVRKSFLETLDDLNAEAYWATAQWALRSLDDPEAVNEVLEDTRGILYGRERVLPHQAPAVMVECLLAGLDNSNARIRDRCRRLVLDYAPDAVSVADIVGWIRSTRDVETTRAIIWKASSGQLGEASADWESRLRARLTEEPDFDAAVELSVALVGMVGEEREAEFLRAGLKNPDPKIHEYFQQILTPPPTEEAPPVEPDDGR